MISASWGIVLTYVCWGNPPMSPVGGLLRATVVGVDSMHEVAPPYLPPLPTPPLPPPTPPQPPPYPPPTSPPTSPPYLPPPHLRLASLDRRLASLDAGANPRTPLCVRRLVCAPPSVCTALPVAP